MGSPPQPASLTGPAARSSSAAPASRLEGQGCEPPRRSRAEAVGKRSASAGSGGSESPGCSPHASGKGRPRPRKLCSLPSGTPRDRVPGRAALPCSYGAGRGGMPDPSAPQTAGAEWPPPAGGTALGRGSSSPGCWARATAEGLLASGWKAASGVGTVAPQRVPSGWWGPHTSWANSVARAAGGERSPEWRCRPAWRWDSLRGVSFDL